MHVEGGGTFFVTLPNFRPDVVPKHPFKERRARPQNLALRAMPATIRRKVSAPSDFVACLCKDDAFTINPAHGVESPTEASKAGETPAISDISTARLYDQRPS